MKVTVEMKNGETYRGTLISAEDTMNITLEDVIRTSRTGQVTTKIINVYLRGNNIKFIALPNVLMNAPILSKVVHMKHKSEQKQQQRSTGGKRKTRD